MNLANSIITSAALALLLTNGNVHQRSQTSPAAESRPRVHCTEREITVESGATIKEIVNTVGEAAGRRVDWTGETETKFELWQMSLTESLRIPSADAVLFLESTLSHYKHIMVPPKFPGDGWRLLRTPSVEANEVRDEAPETKLEQIKDYAKSYKYIKVRVPDSLAECVEYMRVLFDTSKSSAKNGDKSMYITDLGPRANLIFQLLEHVDIETKKLENSGKQQLRQLRAIDRIRRLETSVAAAMDKLKL
ncbi:MAG: hypothetical protein HY286_13615 [Planctomycetes bacterium]|nr:hypothetical protein [Planctomycetota bacterium]